MKFSQIIANVIRLADAYKQAVESSQSAGGLDFGKFLALEEERFREAIQSSPEENALRAYLSGLSVGHIRLLTAIMYYGRDKPQEGWDTLDQHQDMCDSFDGTKEAVGERTGLPSPGRPSRRRFRV